MILAAFALAMSEPSGVAGFYRSNQIEVGAALQLDDDGRFQYQLDYGAVSEAAEGSWSSDGTTVFLTATRMEGAYKAPNFTRQPLKIDGDRLLLSRYDTVIRFEREELPAPADKKSGEQDGDRRSTDQRYQGTDSPRGYSRRADHCHSHCCQRLRRPEDWPDRGDVDPRSGYLDGRAEILPGFDHPGK